MISLRYAPFHHHIVIFPTLFYFRFLGVTSLTNEQQFLNKVRVLLNSKTASPASKEAKRVEKVFSTRCRLLRKVLNFVFLRRKMYDGTSTEQKTKNAKNAVSSKLTAFLKPHRQHFVLPPPLFPKWEAYR